MAKVDFNTKKLTGNINKKLHLFVRKIALDGLRQLVRQSPVDTGRFKANWSSAAKKMDLGTVGAPETKRRRGALSAKPDFRRSSQGISSYKLNQTLYLYNNLVYATILEYGRASGKQHSQQAPKGWMRNTARMMQKKLNEVKDLV